VKRAVLRCDGTRREFAGILGDHKSTRSARFPRCEASALEIISAAPRTGPETQSEGHPLGSFRVLRHAWGVANKKFYRPASGRAKNYRRYLFPVRSRAKATACNVARIINSAIPPLLFLTSVNGSTTFYLFRDACGEYCNATCVRSYRPVCIGIERYVPFSDVHPISHHDLMHGFVAPVIHRSSFAGNGIDRTDHL